jgi:hypothetical protein
MLVDASGHIETDLLRGGDDEFGMDNRHVYLPFALFVRITKKVY